VSLVVESSGSGSSLEVLPLSLLNDFVYCKRRAGLKLLEGWREANEHTVRGDIVHLNTDLSGYQSSPNAILLRALPVWSERFLLSGKCDVVEVQLKPGARPTPGHPLATQLIVSLDPVEFKLGKRRRFENDDAQLCAQALCLEEMFGMPVLRGAVFHADSKRRREVEFTPELRTLTERAIAELHSLFEKLQGATGTGDVPTLPAALWKPACEECSLHNICLPKATTPNSRALDLGRDLFQT